MSKVIDAHVHTFLFKEHWSEWAAEAYAKAGPVTHWATGKLIQAEDFHCPYDFIIEHMDEAGVDECILLGNLQRPHDIIVPIEYMVEAKEAHPDRFHAFWAADVLYPEKSCETIEWSIKEKGFEGVKLLPTYNYIDPLDSRMRMIYRKCSELNVPIVIHSGLGGYGKYNYNKWQEPNYMEPILVENPTINISFGHSGLHRFQDFVALLARHKNLYGDLAYWYWYPLDYLARQLVFAKAFGALDHVMWGTDFHHVSEKLDLERMRKLPKYTRDHDLEPFLDEQDMEKLLGGNAQKFLMKR